MPCIVRPCSALSLAFHLRSAQNLPFCGTKVLFGHLDVILPGVFIFPFNGVIEIALAVVEKTCRSASAHFMVYIEAGFLGVFQAREFQMCY
jgi:hypothetical protein